MKSQDFRFISDHVHTLRFHLVSIPLRIGLVFTRFSDVSELESERFRSDENSGAKLFRSVLPLQRLLFGVTIIGVHTVFRNRFVSEQNETVMCERGLNVLTLWSLIDVPPLFNFSKIFHPGHSYSNPPPAY